MTVLKWEGELERQEEERKEGIRKNKRKKWKKKFLQIRRGRGIEGQGGEWGKEDMRYTMYWYKFPMMNGASCMCKMYQ